MKLFKKEQNAFCRNRPGKRAIESLDLGIINPSTLDYAREKTENVFIKLVDATII